MEYYSLRVTINADTKPVLSFLREFDIYCYILELGKHMDNPHLHAYFETDVNQRTLRSRLRNLGLTGNKAYSLKECDSRYPVPYISYMLKQSTLIVESSDEEISHNVFYFNNIPENILSEASAHNAEIRENTKRSKPSQISKIEEYVRSKLLPLKGHQPIYEDATVLRYILGYYHDNDLMIRKFHIMSLLDTLKIRLHHDPDMALNKLAMEWLSK